MTSDGTTILGSVSAFLGTLGLLLASGLSWLLSIVLSIPFALFLFLLSQTLVPRLDEARQRLNQHKKTVVARGVTPAIEKLHPLARHSLLEELRTFHPIMGSPDRSVVPDTIQWKWLLEHDSRVQQAVAEVAKAEDVFEHAYGEAVVVVIKKAQELGWKPIYESRRPEPGELRGYVFANKVLDAAAPPNSHVADLRHSFSGGGSNMELTLDHSILACGDRLSLEGLLAWVKMSEPDLLQLAGTLVQPHASVIEQRRTLLAVLETVEAEGMVAGRCSACPTTFQPFSRRKRTPPKQASSEDPQGDVTI